MKKILSVLLVLLVLCGCGSNNVTKVSDPDTVILESGTNKVTKQDIYEMVKASGLSDIETDIIRRIAATYDDIDIESIENDVDSYIAMYEAMGYTSYIEYYYGSIEAYRSSMISSSILSALANIYVEDNFDTLTANDNPVQLQMMSFETLEEAQAFVDDINNGSTFDMAAINAGSDTAPTATVYINSSDLDTNIRDYIDSTDTTGLSTIITSTTTTTNEDGEDEDVNTYYVINIVSRDVEDFRDDFISLAVSNLEADTITQYFFTKHNVKVYDQDIYDTLSETYEVGY